MSLVTRIAALAVVVGVGLSGPASAQVRPHAVTPTAPFISEQNGDDALFAAGAVISGQTRGEFVEFVNPAAAVFALNGVTVGDTNQSAATVTATTVTTYDFAFKTAGAPSLAAGQAAVLVSAGTLNPAVVPRNFGGSQIYGKDSTFNDKAAATLPTGDGTTTRSAAYDAGATFGISTSSADAVAAYLGRSATSAVVAGPWVSGTGASGVRTGDTAAGPVSTHPLLGSVAASPGVMANGSSWVTPAAAVAKVSGTGTVSGGGNSFAVNFGTVSQGTTVTVRLSLGNSAGLGGVLAAVGAANATGNVTLTSGGGQTLRLLGGESTSNYGALGTVNGYDYSDGATASDLLFTLDTATLGGKTGAYTFAVRDGFSLLNGDTASPLLGTGTLTINFAGTVAPVPEPAAVLATAAAGLGLARAGRRRAAG